MKEKIIFWIDADLTAFCLAYYLQQVIDAEFYAIIDITNRPKKFFLNQKIVHFEKIWFYHDYVMKKNHDIPDYKTFGLNLDELVTNDRIFNPKYNEYYNFTENEINSILANELLLFNEVFTMQPTIFITTETALRPHHTFHQLCKHKKIKILMLNSANWGNLCYISENYHRMNNFENKFITKKSNSCTFDQLQKRLKEKILSKSLANFYNRNRKSKLQKFYAAFQLLFISNNDNTKTHYTYFGRKKILVLINEIKNTINFLTRQKYIDKNFLNNLPENKNLIFFPLQQEPERSLLISAPHYSNQMKTIDFISKCIPKNYVLVVKEHPTQGPARGWRKLSDYEQFQNNPKIFFIHPSTPASEIIKKSKLVISVSGTASLEASFFNVPSITFVKNDFTMISSIQKFDQDDNMSELIAKTLNLKVNPNQVGTYFDILEENSFSFDLLNFQLDYFSTFYLNGNLVDIEIDNSKMQNFLVQEKEKFSNVINSFKQKIIND